MRDTDTYTDIQMQIQIQRQQLYRYISWACVKIKTYWGIKAVCLYLRIRKTEREIFILNRSFFLHNQINWLLELGLRKC